MTYNPSLVSRCQRQKSWNPNDVPLNNCTHDFFNLDSNTQPLLPLALCDLVAEYTGFHEMDLKMIFQEGELLASSKSVFSQFKYMHHNLACEDMKTVQTYMLHCIAKKKNGFFYDEEIDLYWAPADTGDNCAGPQYSSYSQNTPFESKIFLFTKGTCLV